MLLECLNYFGSDVDDAGGIEREACPEKLDLVLRRERDQPRRPDDGRDVGEIVRTAGDHGRRGGRARGSHHHAVPARPMHQGPQVDEEAHLNAETSGKRDHEVAISLELFQGKVLFRQESKDGEILDADFTPQDEF